MAERAEGFFGRSTIFGGRWGGRAGEVGIAEEGLGLWLKEEKGWRVLEYVARSVVSNE